MKRFAITSQTGGPFRRGDHTFSPLEPVILKEDEITDEHRAEVNNLKIVEVDQDGKPIVTAAERGPDTVSAKDYEAIVKERDALQKKVDSDDSVSKADHEKIVKERDDLAAKLDKAKTEAEEAKSKHEAQVATLEGLVPSTASAIGLMNSEDLKALAEYRGVKVEGDEKAAYVKALSPKGATPK